MSILWNAFRVQHQLVFLARDRYCWFVFLHLLCFFILFRLTYSLGVAAALDTALDGMFGAQAELERTGRFTLETLKCVNSVQDSQSYGLGLSLQKTKSCVMANAGDHWNLEEGEDADLKMHQSLLDSIYYSDPALLSCLGKFLSRYGCDGGLFPWISGFAQVSSGAVQSRLSRTARECCAHYNSGECRISSMLWFL